jgi:hypothetical protein
MNLLSELVFEVIGAFIAWTFKGFKGKFADELAGPYKGNKKSRRNTILSVAFILLIVLILSK